MYFLLSLSNFFRCYVVHIAAVIGVSRMVGYDFLGVVLVGCRNRETVPCLSVGHVP